MRFNTRTRPAELHDLVKEQEDISKRFSEISNGHESALLYAEFSRIDSPTTKKHKEDPMQKQKQKVGPVLGKSERFHAEASSAQTSSSLGRSTHLPEFFRKSSLASDDQPSRSARTSISQRVDNKPANSHEPFARPKDKSYQLDHASTYRILHQCLADVYSPMIAELVSLQNLANLCETHLKLLEQAPQIASDLGKNKGSSQSTFVETSIRKLKDQLEALQDAGDISMKNCIEAGYSMLELDKIIVSNQNESRQENMTKAPADFKDTISYKVHGSETNDDISDDADAYYSTAE